MHSSNSSMLGMLSLRCTGESFCRCFHCMVHPQSMLSCQLKRKIIHTPTTPTHTHTHTHAHETSSGKLSRHPQEIAENSLSNLTHIQKKPTRNRKRIQPTNCSRNPQEIMNTTRKQQESQKNSLKDSTRHPTRDIPKT